MRTIAMAAPEISKNHEGYLPRASIFVRRSFQKLNNAPAHSSKLTSFPLSSKCTLGPPPHLPTP